MIQSLIRACKECGVDISLKGYRFKFCSRKCASSNHYKNNKALKIKQAANWRKKNPERYKPAQEKAMKKFLLEKRPRFNELMRKDSVKNKDKWNARRLARAHISLVGKSCLICGSLKKLERHHEDYTKPLIVKILCKKCHEKEDSK